MLSKYQMAAILASCGLVAAACSTSEAGSEPQDLIQTSALVSYDSCDALLGELNSLAREQVGPYGFDSYGGGFAEISDTFAVEESASMDDSADFAVERRAVSKAESFTGTNNQEVFVDEADLVKTNGEIIALVQNQILYIIDASENVVKHEIDLPEGSYSGEIFITGDSILLMTSVEEIYEEVFDDFAVDSSYYYNPGDTRILPIDIDTGKAGEPTDIAGRYISARMVDGVVRLVVANDAPRLDFVYPSSGSNRAEQTALEANKNLINDLTISDWLPVDQDGRRVVECDSLFIPENFAGFGFVNVVTIDENLKIADATAVLTDAQDVYASTDRLVVSTPEWNEPGLIGRALDIDPDYETALHSFDISNPARTSYVASGKVPGTLLNRYSISEHEGFLRVATTEGSPWGRNSTENMVTVLEESDGKLAVVGRVEDIARGENITAVRFFGDIAYVVTFEQIDPFFTIDLSDPTKPEVMGELKIPGFSSYLHPLDDNRVFAVGTDGTDEGANGAVAASLFDVSDLNDPKLVSKVVLTERWGYSPVASDARAFQIWEDTALIPVSDESELESNSRLAFVEIDGNELEIKGSVSHPKDEVCERYFDGPYPVEPFEESFEDFAEELEAEDYIGRPVEECYTFQPNISRSLVISDNVYSVSEAGILVSDFNSLDRLDWIEL